MSTDERTHIVELLEIQCHKPVWGSNEIKETEQLLVRLARLAGRSKRAPYDPDCDDPEIGEGYLELGCFPPSIAVPLLGDILNRQRYGLVSLKWVARALIEMHNPRADAAIFQIAQTLKSEDQKITLVECLEPWDNLQKIRILEGYSQSPDPMLVIIAKKAIRKMKPV